MAPAAHAARPFVTDDARVVEKGHCQAELFYKEQRTYSGSEFGFLPACNPSFLPLAHGAEITIGTNRVEGERNTVVQGKFLFKELPTDGLGLAGTLGSSGGDTFVNGIASFSFFDERAVMHANLGHLQGVGATGGIGFEALLAAPRLYGIAETYGQRGEKPTLHYGVRYWIVPNRFQLDATRGDQRGDPVRRFYTLGLRFIF